jgi:prophage antirepressor-like protein
MFELTNTFKNEEIGFSITPIFMQNKGFVFLLQELQVQLGYDDLPNMIKISESFLEGVEYLVLRNGNLKEIKEMLHVGSRSSNSLASIYDSIKFAPSLIVLSESGLYTCVILSRKPNALSFRRWVTCEVLPSIRQTGMYKMPGTTFYRILW